MFNAWGYGVYFFFASMMILSVFFVWFFIPETKGIPLEAMDRLFATKPTWRAHGVLMDELRVNEEAFRLNAGGVNTVDEKADATEIESKRNGSVAGQV
jgi:hypothetical protein